MQQPKRVAAVFAENYGVAPRGRAVAPGISTPSEPCQPPELQLGLSRDGLG